MKPTWPGAIGACLIQCAAVASAQLPAAPLLDAVRGGGGTDVVLSWPADPLATGYRVFRGDDLARPLIEIAQTAVPFFVDPGAVAGPPDLLYYRVHGENPGGLGPGSNLAFKLNLTIDCLAGYYCALSIPYRFWPNGAVGTPQTDHDVCDYFGPAITAVRVEREDTGGCVRQFTRACIQPFTRFSLLRGDAIEVKPAGLPFVAALVGAHDPEFHPGGASSVSLGNNCPFCLYLPRTVSLPYHAAAGRASELCAELVATATPVLGVAEALGNAPAGPLYHYCGAAADDFALRPGLAYEVRTRAAGAWQPVVR